ncbi:MAG: DUF1302 family protein [Planctomycetota bacterium]
MDKITFGFIIFVSVICAAYVRADDEDGKLSLHGFLQANYSVRTGNPDTGSLKNGDFLLGEERLQLELEKQAGEGKAFLKADLFHNALDGSSDMELREGYLNLNLDSFNLRLGRQIITWGIADFLFINDVFPKDWSAFFSGRPLEYLKIGTDCIKTDFKIGATSAEIIAAPFFQPDNLPSGESFFFYNPMAGISQNEEKPDREKENTEFALRLYRNIAGTDFALYTYKGFFRSPAMQPDTLPVPTLITLHYPDLRVYGLSAQRTLFQGVTGLELGFYDSRDDRDGTDPFIPNSHTRGLLSYQRQLWSDCTAYLQYYGEYMSRYNDYKNNLMPGFPEQDHLRQVATFRLTHFFDYQTWQVSLLMFYGVSEKDYFIIPEVKYQVNDQFWIALGLNLFGGENDTTFFGQFEKNDNLYLAVRSNF